MSYNNETTIADAYDFLTAVDSNDPVESARYWQDGPEKNAAEARENDWTLKGDWSQVWNDVLDRIAERLYGNDPEVIARASEPGAGDVTLGDATLEQCRTYLQHVGSDEGWIDGGLIGHPGHTVYIG